MVQVDYFRKYDHFHENFTGDVKTLNCGYICEKCQNNCEAVPDDDEIDYKFIILFLPYEVEYICRKLGFDPAEFKDKYLNGIQDGDLIIDFLKFDRECPFLNKDFSCDLGEF